MTLTKSKYQTFISFVRDKSERGSIESLLETTPSKLILLFPEVLSISFARVNQITGIVKLAGMAGSSHGWEVENLRELFTFDPAIPLDNLTDEYREEIVQKMKGGERAYLEMIPLRGSGKNLEGFFIIMLNEESPFREGIIQEIKGLIDFLGLTIENLKLKGQIKDLRSYMDLLEMRTAVERFDPSVEIRGYVEEIQRSAGDLFGSKVSILFKKASDSLVYISSSEEAKPHLAFEPTTGTFKIFLMGRNGSALEDIPVRDHYKKIIKDHIGRIFHQGTFTNVIALPISITRKDNYIVAIFFEEIDDAQATFLMEMATSLEHLIMEAGEVTLTRNALKQTAEELISEKNRKRRLLEITDTISSTLDINHSMNLAVSRVKEHFRAEFCAIFTKVPEREEAILRFLSASEEPLEQHLGRSVRASDFPCLSFPYMEKKAMVVNNPGELDLNPKERNLISDLNIGRFMSIPIIHHGEFIGILSIARVEGKETFSERDLEFAAAVGNQISTSISNSRLFTQVLKSKLEWETIFNSISDGIFVIDNDYRVVNCNNRFAQKFNIPIDQVKGKRCYELFACDKIGTGDCDHAICVKDMKPSQSFYRSMSIPGTYKVTIFPVIDEAGKVEKSVHLLSDISKEVEYEKKIKESLTKARRMSSYLETLIESSPDSIISTNVDGHIEYFNRGAAELLGYKAHEIIGKHVSAVYPSLNDAKAVGAAMRMGGGIVRNFNTFLKKKDGDLIEVILSVSSINDGKGNKIGTVGFSKDVSRIKKMEDQLRQSEKLTSLGKLASGIAHDFNNILASISMRTELLKMKTSEQEILSELSVIENAAIKGSDTVNKLKSFYRREQQEFHSIDINDVIHDAVEITSPRWKDMSQSKGIITEIDLNLQEGLNPIGGNEGELKDMVINLIINSLDAMPEGGRITIETCLFDEWVRMIFSDSGIGMNPEIIERVFEPFFSTKGEMGSGLGLSTVYGIVSSHGGQVELESEPGRGTTFTIDFPIKTGEDEAEIIEDLEPTGNLMGTRVIIFEDENTLRESIREILIAKGCKVHDFENSREGLAFMEKDLPSKAGEEKIIVITDLGMPDINGFEIAKKTKAFNHHIPVIMITGWGRFIESRQGNIHGVDRILSKPLRSSDLFRVIEEVSL